MLTAMFLMWLFGGDSIEVFQRDDFRAVNTVVIEAPRAAAVSQSMERINVELERVVELRNGISAGFNRIDDLVGAQQAEYDAIFAPLWSARREAQAVYIDELFAMREHMTREEWEQVFNAPE